MVVPKKLNIQVVGWAWFAGVLTWLAAVPMLFQYFEWRVIQVFYLILVGLTVRVVRPHQFTNRFGWLSLASLILFSLTFSKVFFLYSLICFSLLIVEQSQGSINYIPIFSGALATPFFGFFFEMLGFPIRLFLSKTAGMALSLLYANVNTSGNLIQINGLDFLVDEACMGLNMLQIGLLMSLVLAAFIEREKEGQFQIPQILIILIVSMLMIIVANWFRIILIVLFRAMPDTVLHEMIGLICLAVYGLVPIYFLLRQLVPGKVNQTEEEIPSPSRGQWLLPMLLMVAISIAGWNTRLTKRSVTEILPVEFKGFEVAKSTDGTIKYQKHDELVYIKPGVPVYAAEHTPKICWAGGGYNWLDEQITTIENEKVKIAKIETPEGTILYTAWWFDNGHDRVISQLDWRIKVLQGNPRYHLVNVTCQEKSRLREAVTFWRSSLNYKHQ